MRRISVSGLVFAALAGVTLAACNFVLGLGGDNFGSGGAGSAAMTGTGAANGTGAGNAGTGSGGGPPSTGGLGVWSNSFAGASVASMAAGPNHTLYLTGGVTGPNPFSCKTVTDAGDGADAGMGTGFLVQLDGSSGECVWAFFFGGSMPGDGAQGTGVAVDPAGNVALTGTFTGKATIVWPMMAGMTDSFVSLFDNTAAHNPVWAVQIGDGMGMGMMGNQVTTGVAANGTTVAVSGSYTNSLSAIDASASMYKLATKSDNQDGFAMWLGEGPGGTATPVEVGVMSPTPSMVSHIANGVALDNMGNVAFAGTTVGATELTNQPMVPVMSLSGSIFLASYQVASAANFETVFDGDSQQHGTCVVYDATNDVIVGGDFTGPVGVVDGGAAYASNGTSVVVARYDGAGAPQGSFQLGSETMPATVTVAGIAPWPVNGFKDGTYDGGSSVALAGNFSGNVSFDDGGSRLASMGSQSDVYVAKVTPTLAQLVWARSFGAGVGVTKAVAVDPIDASIFVAGQFQGSLAFGGGAGMLNSQGANDLFVAKLTP